MTDKKETDEVMEIMTKSMMIVMVLAAVAPMLPSLLQGLTGILPAAQAAGGVGALEYRGIVDYREIKVTPTVGWLDLIQDPPYRPWIHAFIINDGPAAVEIGINHPNDRFVMGMGETRTIDRSGADELIYSVFFVCPRGKVADLRITGEY